MQTQANGVLLVAFLDAFKGNKSISKKTAEAKKAREGMYVKLMTEAAKFQSAAEAHATLDALTDNIAGNVGGAAVAIGAEPRKTETEGGKTHKVPDVVSNVKATILYAFDNGISLFKKDGTLDSYSAIRSARTADKAVKEKEAEELAIAKLSGLDLARFTAIQGLKQLALMLPSFNAEQVTEVQNWTEMWTKPAPKADVVATLTEGEAAPKVTKAKKLKTA